MGRASFLCLGVVSGGRWFLGLPSPLKEVSLFLVRGVGPCLRVPGGRASGDRFYKIQDFRGRAFVVVCMGGRGLLYWGPSVNAYKLHALIKFDHGGGGGKVGQEVGGHGVKGGPCEPAFFECVAVQKFKGVCPSVGGQKLRYYVSLCLGQFFRFHGRAFLSAFRRLCYHA